MVVPCVGSAKNVDLGRVNGLATIIGRPVEKTSKNNTVHPSRRRDRLVNTN